MAELRHVFLVPCHSHGLQLFVGDILTQPWVAKILKPTPVYCSVTHVCYDHVKNDSRKISKEVRRDQNNHFLLTPSEITIISIWPSIWVLMISHLTFHSRIRLPFQSSIKSCLSATMNPFLGSYHFTNL